MARLTYKLEDLKSNHKAKCQQPRQARKSLLQQLEHVKQYTKITSLEHRYKEFAIQSQEDKERAIKQVIKLLCFINKELEVKEDKINALNYQNKELIYNKEGLSTELTKKEAIIKYLQEQARQPLVAPLARDFTQAHRPQTKEL